MDQTQVQPLVLLTATQKQAIRNHACALCLAMPPFLDGTRCHVHRMRRGRDGGQYIAENVLPLCPPCHRAVDRMAALGVLSAEQLAANGRKAAATNNERKRLYGLTPAETSQLRKNGHRTHELHPDLAAGIGRKSGPKNIIKLLALPKSERLANARLGGLAVHANKTPEERSALMRKVQAAKTAVARSAASRKASKTRMAKLTSEEKLAFGRKLAAAKWANYRKNGPSERALAYYARKRGVRVCSGTRAPKSQLSLDLPT